MSPLKAMRIIYQTQSQGYENTASLSCPYIWVRKPDYLHLHFTLSKMFLNLSSFFKILFFNVALPGCFFYFVFQITDSSNLQLIHSSVLFISDIGFFISNCFFLCFLFFFRAIEYPYNNYSNLYDDKLFASLSSSSSSGEFSCSFIWGLFLCFPIWAASLCLFLCIR